MATEDDRKLFVAGLAESITEDVLRQIFEGTGGKVVDVSLPKDRATGRPRGFGFVTLATAAEASAARDSLDGSMHGGRPLSIRAFQSEAPRRGEGGGRGGGERERGGERDRADRDRSERVGDRDRGIDRGGGDRTLYVGNLPYDCDQRTVEELFAGCAAGAVVRIHLPTGPDGRPRGFGFVTMGSAEAATGAIEALREVELKGRRLMINIAHPRGETRVSERPEVPRQAREPRELPPREREAPPVERRRPPFIGPAPSAPPPDFLDPARAEGRRRAERPEKKVKKPKGKQERLAAKQKRGREKHHWEDWEED